MLLRFAGLPDLARTDMALARFWRSPSRPPFIRTIAATALLTLGSIVSLPSMAEAPTRLRSVVLPSACSKQAPQLGAKFDAIFNYAVSDRAAISPLLGLREHPQAARSYCQHGGRRRRTEHQWQGASATPRSAASPCQIASTAASTKTYQAERSTGHPLSPHGLEV